MSVDFIPRGRFLWQQFLFLSGQISMAQVLFLSRGRFLWEEMPFLQGRFLQEQILFLGVEFCGNRFHSYGVDFYGRKFHFCGVDLFLGVDFYGSRFLSWEQISVGLHLISMGVDFVSLEQIFMGVDFISVGVDFVSLGQISFLGVDFFGSRFLFYGNLLRFCGVDFIPGSTFPSTAQSLLKPCDHIGGSAESPFSFRHQKTSALLAVSVLGRGGASKDQFFLDPQCVSFQSPRQGERPRGEYLGQVWTPHRLSETHLQCSSAEEAPIESLNEPQFPSRSFLGRS